MTLTRPNLLLPFRSLALAAMLAVAASLVAAPRADAQLARQLPSPVSAAQLAEFMQDARIADSAKDTVLKLHEAYFERFRAFEKAEVDPALARPSDSPFDLVRSVEDAKKDASMRRRLFQRAGQLDGQLVDEIAGALDPADGWKAERLRQSLTRRRASLLAPGFGMAAWPLDYSLRRAPVWNEVDADTLRISSTVLDAYDAELTRSVERYAEVALNRGVRAAEIREELGLDAPPAPAEGGEAVPLGDEWFGKMREVQSRASADSTKALARVRKIHRDGLEQVMPFLPPHQARALRRHLVSSVYKLLQVPSEFDKVYEIALAKRKDGEIGRSAWEPIQRIAEANELATRPLVAELMELADKQAEEAMPGFIVVGDAPYGRDGEDKSEKIRKGLADIDSANADTLRAAIGLPKPEPERKREVKLGDLNLDAVVGSAIMVGGDGEMVVLSDDDFAGGDFLFSGMGGMGGVARPMSREELDTLALRLGFNEESRPVFDEIAARAAAARNAAEAEHKPKQTFEAGGEAGGEDGGMTFTITLSGDDGGAIMGDAGDREALVAAIDKTEEAMFDELAAATAADKASAVESARRARARIRLLPGETGAQAVDLAALPEKAALPEPARVRLADPLRAWDEASVAAIRSMKGEVTALEKERTELFESAMTETKEDDGEGSVSVQRAMSISGETAERLEQIEGRIRVARDRVAETNRRTLEGLVAALDGDAESQRALRRAFLRAANPSTYKLARDLEPFFTKASGLVGDDAVARDVVATMRGEWIEAREARCEEYLVDKEKAKQADSGGDPADGMKAMQLGMRERRKLREDLEQIEATAFRKLQDALIATIGAQKAMELGELPARKRPSMPAIQIGN